MSAMQKSAKPPILAGFGNPLLDICVILNDNSFYEKFGFERDGQKEITAAELQTLLGYFKNLQYEFKYCAGGSAQNSLRIFQWLLKQPYSSVFFGGVGNDEQGILLEKEVSSANVCPRYTKQNDYSTGTCIAITKDVDRFLVAHLGAANIYSVSDFITEENVNIVSKLYIAYIEGFFISHSFETALEVIKLCKDNGVLIAFNLSGVYLFKNYYKEILHMLKSADIVIGNGSEYNEFWKYFTGNHTNLKDILITIQSNLVTGELVMKTKKSLKLSRFEGLQRLVVCTQGSDNVLCVHGNKEFLQMEPKVLDQSLIKDTTGAGDAFAGGVLTGLVQNKNINEIIELGCWASGQIIQQVGCSIPK